MKYRSKNTAVKKFVNMAMPCFLSQSSKYRGGCGDSRGMTGLFRLGECNDSITTHLNGVWTNSNESGCFWTAASKGQRNDDLPEAPSFLGKILEAASAMPVSYVWRREKSHQEPGRGERQHRKGNKKTPRSNCANRFRFDNCLCILALCLFVCLFVCLFLLHMQVDLYFSPKKIQCPIFSKFLK